MEKDQLEVLIRQVIRDLQSERLKCIEEISKLQRVSGSKQVIVLRKLEDEIDFFGSWNIDISLDDRSMGSDLEIEQVIILVERINGILEDSPGSSRCFAHDLFNPNSKFYELANILDHFGVGNANHTMFRVKGLIHHQK